MTLIYSYIISIFLSTDNASYRIWGMTPANLVSILMFIVLAVTFLMNRSVSVRRKTIVSLLLLSFSCTVISYLISFFIPSKEVPIEAYSFVWATGVNSPRFRGLVFLVRFLLGIVVLCYIMVMIDTKSKWIKLIRFFFYTYTLYMIIPLLQVIIFYILGLKIGRIFDSDVLNTIRVGGFMGEPSVLASLIVPGFFLSLYFSKIENNFIIKKPLILLSLFLSIFGLLFTMSSAVIVGFLIYTVFYISLSTHVNTAQRVFIFVFFILCCFPFLIQTSLLGKITGELTNIGLRTLSWLVGIEIFRNNLIWGIGLGRSPFFVGENLPSYIPKPSFWGIEFNYTEMRCPPMNTYIEWTAETGLIGLCALLILGLTLGYYSIKYLKMIKYHTNRTYVFPLFGAISVLLIAFNSFPGGFYMSHFLFILGMFISSISGTFERNEK